MKSFLSCWTKWKQINPCTFSPSLPVKQFSSCHLIHKSANIENCIKPFNIILYSLSRLSMGWKNKSIELLEIYLNIHEQLRECMCFHNDLKCYLQCAEKVNKKCKLTPKVCCWQAGMSILLSCHIMDITSITH